MFGFKCAKHQKRPPNQAVHLNLCVNYNMWWTAVSMGSVTGLQLHRQTVVHYAAFNTCQTKESALAHTEKDNKVREQCCQSLQLKCVLTVFPKEVEVGSHSSAAYTALERIERPKLSVSVIFLFKCIFLSKNIICFNIYNINY